MPRPRLPLFSPREFSFAHLALIIDEAPFAFHCRRPIAKSGRKRRRLFAALARLERKRQRVAADVPAERSLRLRRAMPALAGHIFAILRERAGNRVRVASEGWG